MSSLGSLYDDDSDSFRERVKKTFGSLSFSPPSSSSPNPPWSLSGEEVEKREWRRDRDTARAARDSNPCSSSLDELFHRNRSRKSAVASHDEVEDLDDTEEEGVDGSGRDERQIRSSIGLDSTLDNEEEEDIDDRVATGIENAGDRLYMKSVAESHPKPYDDDYVFSVFHKDPRANHWAAVTRLKEDAARSPTCPKEVVGASPAPSGTKENLGHPSSANTSSVKEAGIIASDGSLKPILKRKGLEEDSSSKPSKRVRFQPGCKFDEPLHVMDEESSGATDGMDSTSEDDNSPFSQKKTTLSVPGYVMDRSKYTRYSLNSTSDINDQSNNDSYLDFHALVKGKENREVESGLENKGVSADDLSSVVYIPRRRSNSNASAASVNPDGDGESHLLSKSISFRNAHIVKARLESQEVAASEMEVDEPRSETAGKLVTFKKPSRQYRSRSGLEEV